MKRIVSILVVIALAMAVPALAFDPVRSSPQTADATITSGKAFFSGFLIQPDGTNDVAVVFYDNTSAAGTKILPDLTFAGDGGTKMISLDNPIECNTGIYIDVTTAGTVGYTVFFVKR